MKVIIDCCFGNILPATAEATENAEKYGCMACEFIQKNKIHRCNKFICLAGRTPDGKDVDEWRCSESWIPTLLVENAMTNRGQTEAICSMRNESVKRQDAVLELILPNHNIRD